MTNDPAVASALLDLIDLFTTLRERCPWKAEQTHSSLIRYLVEESYEVIEAIEAGDPDDLRDELGDLLLQVYFHAVIADEAGHFDIEEVAAGLRDKLIRRNPHVFSNETGSESEAGRRGPATGKSAAEIDATWQAIKAQEKQRAHPMEGVPGGLPALLYADKAISRMGRQSPENGFGRVPEEALTEAALGDQLLALVAQAHDQGLDPELALRRAVRRRVLNPEESTQLE